MSEYSINHCDICMLLYNGNTNEAIKLFTQVTQKISFSPFTRNVYLSSLNFAIYNYILLKENVSLHHCCIENEKKIMQSTNHSLLEIGKNIILAYSLDNQYLIEKYQNPHVKAAISYIHQHLSEPLTLEIVSTAICINKTYLCQLFKKEVKMGFCDYILNQRIKLAKNLLKKNNYYIKDIAEKCGFKNATYFATCYKKYTGNSPSCIYKKIPENHFNG